VPLLADFNADLSELGPTDMLRRLVPQLAPADRLLVADDEATGEAADAG
jgi:hypothetical protein